MRKFPIFAILALSASALSFGATPAAAVPSSICDSVSGNLIQNCGFESGDFTGWTLSGNTGFAGVTAGGQNSGNYASFLGAVGSLGYASQTFSDQNGASYAISLWYNSDGGIHNEFDVEWNGTNLFDMTDIAAHGYQELMFTAIGTGSDTLKISERDDPGFLFLDDVVVARVPEPGSLVLLGSGLIGFAVARRRRKQQV